VSTPAPDQKYPLAISGTIRARSTHASKLSKESMQVSDIDVTASAGRPENRSAGRRTKERTTMNNTVMPAACRNGGVRPSAPPVPWDVVTFRRSLEDGSTVEVTIDRAKLARVIARRIRANVGEQATAFYSAITAIVHQAEPSAEVA
jgi:hypothetical protein